MKFKEIVEKCAQITSERPDKIVTLNAGRSIYIRAQLEEKENQLKEWFLLIKLEKKRTHCIF